MKSDWKLKLGVRALELWFNFGEATFGLISDVFYTALKLV